MQPKLKGIQYLTIASMLFGLFFGAGNLIFPVQMGQQAGREIWPAVGGFLVTGVGLPLLGVIALGLSRCNGLAQLSSRVGRRYSLFFTCALYLTIGPFFAIPRCATVPFEVGMIPLLSQGGEHNLALVIFSLAFFLAVLWFSLRPGKILTWVGKVLNPLFLLFLGALMVTALLHPLGNIQQIEPVEAYADSAFFKGFLEGYNTMDALAGLAFGIVVVNVIRGLGVQEPGEIARSTVKAGLLSSVIMAAIYIAVTAAGAQSRGSYPLNTNGGETLLLIANHYFGSAGGAILAGTVTFACLKTAVGLITSCGTTFHELFPSRVGYRGWAVLFCLISFLVATLGLEAIVAYSLPVLMFLYPLAITLILLTLFGRFFGNDPRVYTWVTFFTLAAALFDFVKSLPASLRSFLHLDGLVELANKYLPFFSLGLGWLIPAAIGLVIGVVIHLSLPARQSGEGI